MAHQCPTCICYAPQRDECILTGCPECYPVIPEKIYFGKEKCKHYFAK